MRFNKCKVQLATALRSLEPGFFTLATLPELSEGRNTKEQIEVCFKARKEKISEPFFD